MIILGIDPGSRLTGYGLIQVTPNQSIYLSSGVLKIKNDSFPNKLKQIFDGILNIVEMYQPEQMAIEQVFVGKNPDSALKLGQARGAAICAVQYRDIPVFEYAAREIKQTIVGHGNADKLQVQFMIKRLLNLQGEMSVDSSDALAIALCHSMNLKKNIII